MINLYTGGDCYTSGSYLTNIENAWPYIIAKEHKLSMLNDAYPGSSNDRISYHAVKHINEHNFFLIAWSSIKVLTFYDNSNNYDIAFNPVLHNVTYSDNPYYKDFGTLLYKHWFSEIVAFKKWLQQIAQLQALLEKHQKPYLMVNTFNNNISKWCTQEENKFIEKTSPILDYMSDDYILSEHSEIQHYLSLIDTAKFYKWGEFCIRDLEKDYSYLGGLSEEGHRVLAQKISNHLINHNIL